MGVDAALVGGDQYLGADPGVLFGYADALEHVDHELFHAVERNMMNHFYLPLVDLKSETLISKSEINPKVPMREKPNFFH